MDGRVFLRISIVATFLALCLPIRAGADASFPEFENIRPNVTFWIKVYSRYTTSQAIIHDSRHLDIIYDVIDVRPYDAPGARKINRSLTKRAKAKTEAILARLAADPSAADPEARRVKGLFGADATAKDFRNARHRVRSQIGQKDRFRSGLVRSGAYIDQIRAIFSAYGLPEKLAYLPHVESSFDIKAYSKFGAAGIWQFTRSTGRRFMTVGYVLDERRDPIAATHGAAKLLKENFEKLGSWPLAITAYNHGAAGMARAKNAHGSYPRIVEAYRSRSFKFASKNFYSEFLAASRIAADPTPYFGTLRFEAPVRYRTVTLGGYASLGDVCDHFNVDPDVLRAMNPALRPPVFNGQKYLPKGYRLHLPQSAGDGGLRLADMPVSLYKDAQKPSRFYTVQKGDTAGRIARIHRVALADLILANNLNRRATIYPRQTLRIPLPGETVAPRAEPKIPSAAPAPEKEAPSVGATASVEAPPPQAPAMTLDPPGESVPDAPHTTGTSDAVSVAGIQERDAQSDASPISKSPRDQDPVAVLPGFPEADEPAGDGVLSGLPSENEEEGGLPTEAKVSSAIPTVEEDTKTKGGRPSMATPEAVSDADGSGRGPRTTPDGPSVPGPGASRQPQLETEPEPSVGVAETPSPTSQGQPGGTADAPEVLQPDSVPAEPVPSQEIVATEVRFDQVIGAGEHLVGVLTVGVEETLGHFADWARVRTQEIRRLNSLDFGRPIDLMQTVKIPLKNTTAEAFEERRYEYHKRLQEDFFAVYQVAEVEPYRVRSGDNIWTLCRNRFGMPMWLVQHFNSGVDLAALRLNQTLMIPQIETSPDGVPDVDGEEGSG